jgi:hypothetical protein
MLLEDGPPYGGDVMVSPADFLILGAVPLNELAVVMDVRPVREEMSWDPSRGLTLWLRGLRGG